MLTTNSAWICWLVLATLMRIISKSVTLAQFAPVICQTNDHDNNGSICTYFEGSCVEENTLIHDSTVCTSTQQQSATRTTSVHPHVHSCPLNYNLFEYDHCPNSFHTDVAQTVGHFGKPDWVGAQFQSLSYNSFSMSVMWEHKDAAKLQNRTDLSAVRGYEIRIYQKVINSGEKTLRKCLCVTDPHIRNISDIYSRTFNYRSAEDELSHMIVEVRTYPSSSIASTRVNCSLATGCAQRNTSEKCIASPKQCYSWPQSCLDFMPSYSPETCTPPRYGPPTNVTATTYRHYSSDKDSTNSSASMNMAISWTPPDMNYDLFPFPNVYYIELKDHGTGLKISFKAIYTTNITIFNLQLNTTYSALINAYVPCSGLSAYVEFQEVGCGRVCELTVQPPSQLITTTGTLETTTQSTVSNHLPYIYYGVAATLTGILLIIALCITTINAYTTFKCFKQQSGPVAANNYTRVRAELDTHNDLCNLKRDSMTS